MVSLKLRAAQGKVLRPVHPNAGLEAEYRRQLHSLIERMHFSVKYWLTAGYRHNEPVLAQDSPASALQKIVKQLGRRWSRVFGFLSRKLARVFVRKVSTQTDQQIKRSLGTAGIGLELTTTDVMRDITHAAIHQNVALIKSIPQHYFSEVEQLVMRAVQTGDDPETLREDLEERYSITRRRATVIANTQISMATASLVRARLVDLGLDSIWQYTWRSKEPRRQHVEMDGQRFSPRVGLWDSHERQMVFPGSLINCKCVSRPAIPI
jgi:uncharacterized protein with gpF-like domain